MTAPRTTYLACYDIAESARRLVRVRRVLMGAGVPVQYSVFLTTLTRAERAALLRRLACTIDPRRDDVRLYPIPADPHLELLGRPVLPTGVLAGAPGVIPKPRAEPTGRGTIDHACSPGEPGRSGLGKSEREP